MCQGKGLQSISGFCGTTAGEKQAIESEHVAFFIGWLTTFADKTT